MHMARGKLCASIMTALGVAAALAPVAAFAQAGADESSDHIGCGKGQALMRLFEAGRNPDGSAVSGWGGAPEVLAATDLLHCALDIEFITGDPLKNIRGSNTMTVKSLVNGLTEFTFCLRYNMTVTLLMVDGEPATATVPPTDGSSYLRTITLPHAYNAGDIFTVVIGYEGLGASLGFGSIQAGTLGGAPAIFSLSEPYYAGTWWPVKDGDVFQAGDNSDKFTCEVAITAPAAMTSVSNGVLQGIDDLSGDRKRARWASAYPIAPYLVLVASAVYNRYESTYTYAGGAMPLPLYLSPTSTADPVAVGAMCASMLGVFKGTFGLYPFINEGYGLHQSLGGVAMEHQTMTSQPSFYESLTSHELSHQWWGDDVTCKTWNHIWLNEGFATYGEALWEERKPGASATALKTAMSNRKPNDATVTVYRADTSTTSKIFNQDAVYNKGAWVLHMLRHVVGDDVFFQILADYRAAFHGGAATTADFVAIASSTSGQDLSWFFDEWVYNGGAPTHKYRGQTVKVNGQRYMQMMVKQIQSGPLFRMPLDVRINTPFGGGVQTIKINNDAVAAQWFLVPINVINDQSSFFIDQDGWLLGGHGTTTYEQGPPKIALAFPAPGAVIPALSAPSSVTLWFSDNVTTSASDYTLTQNDTPVPMTFAYNAATFSTTLSADGPLAPGVYTLSVSDTVKTVAGAIALDGEILDPVNPASLPSGNGVPSGAAAFTFVVEPCPADVNSDGYVNGEDFDEFVAAFEWGDPFADFDGNSFVNGVDFDGFVEAFVAGC